MDDDRRNQSVRQVMAEDIDELAHMSNVSVVRWIQDAARDASTVRGWDFARYTAFGAFFVVRRHEVEYLRQAFEGEELTLTTWVSSWKGASSWRETRITRGEDMIVRARTLWAFMDTTSHRPRRIPPEMRETFAAIEGELA
jgi:acyl-CoA thioester hydrolase